MKTITLCGSTKFRKEFEQAMRDETLKGNIVLSVGLFGHEEGMDMTSQTKKMLDQLHFRKIDLSDEIFVINPGGYIGLSTCDEIHYALSQYKEVRYLEEPCVTKIRTLIKADVPTPAGRVYSHEMLKNICSMPIPEYGTIGHSTDYEIRVDHISHKNLNLFIDDEDYLSVNIKTFDTPKGEMLKRWIEYSGENKAFINICFNVDKFGEIIGIVSLPVDMHT